VASPPDDRDLITRTNRANENSSRTDGNNDNDNNERNGRRKKSLPATALTVFVLAAQEAL
jgi:hypothetical protein